MYDDVTTEEKELLFKDICPDCGETGFLEGPSGGGSTNVRCANDKCKAKFNICGSLTPQRLEYGLIIKGIEEEEKKEEEKNKFTRFSIMDI